MKCYWNLHSSAAIAHGIAAPEDFNFYFLITYRVCKRKKYCNRKIRQNSPFDECLCFVRLRTQNEQTNISVCLCLPVGLYVCLSVRPVRMHNKFWRKCCVSKRNSVGVFYLGNAVLVLKTKVKSWFWSWFSSGFWFWRKRCVTTPNLVSIFNIWNI